MKNNITETKKQAPLPKKLKVIIPPEIHGDLNFWWHPHANMDTFWSGTDLDTIAQCADKRINNQGDIYEKQY